MNHSDTPKFTRRIEDFRCERCGALVQGNGYTNHCPSCLWSRHVDINPGDRASQCGGLMEPLSVQKRGERYVIVHRCEQCGFERRQSAAAHDNMDALIAVAAAPRRPR